MRGNEITAATQQETEESNRKQSKGKSKYTDDVNEHLLVA
jgi:hypothetical protein